MKLKHTEKLNIKTDAIYKPKQRLEKDLDGKRFKWKTVKVTRTNTLQLVTCRITPTAINPHIRLLFFVLAYF